MEELLPLSLEEGGIPLPTYIVLLRFTFLVFYGGVGGGGLIFGVDFERGLQHPVVPKLIQDLLAIQI